MSRHKPQFRKRRTRYFHLTVGIEVPARNAAQWRWEKARLMNCVLLELSCAMCSEVQGIFVIQPWHTEQRERAKEISDAIRSSHRCTEELESTTLTLSSIEVDHVRTSDLSRWKRSGKRPMPLFGTTRATWDAVDDAKGRVCAPEARARWNAMLGAQLDRFAEQNARLGRMAEHIRTVARTAGAELGDA